MLEKNQIIELNIHSISSDGNGVGLFEGIAVFVPYTAIGDILMVKIVKPKKTFAFGIIEKIINPSCDRIEPECSSYKRCGGCSFRHISYQAELIAKRDIVHSALTRLGGLEIEVNNSVQSPQISRYRNKVQFPVSMNEGRLSVGLFAKRSHSVISAESCDLQPQLLNDIAVFACAALDEQGVIAYNEEQHKGLLRHIFLRKSGKTDCVMLCLVLNGIRIPDESSFAKKLTNQFPQISSIILNKNTAKGNVILGEKCRTILGDDFLIDEMSGVPVYLSPLSFFQVNTKAAEKLYEIAAQLADLKENDTLLDLYCGTGTIGLFIAKNQKLKRLIGVEVVQSAVADATKNAKAMGLNNCEFIQNDAAGAAQLLAQNKTKIDVAILDPPRKGCDEQTLNAVLQMSPQKIVMISCNPATLARDLKYLCANGYGCKTATPVDLFPRTAHVECVVLMSRK